MAGAGDLGLDEEEVRAGIGDELGVLPRGAWRGRHRGDAALGLDARHDRGDEVGPDRHFVGLGQHARGFRSTLRGNDLLDDRAGVVIAGVQALEVHEGNPAMARHADGEVGIGHRVHRGRHERDLQAISTEIGRQVDLGRIDGDGAGHEGDFLEAVGAPQPAVGRVADGCLVDQ